MMHLQLEDLERLFRVVCHSDLDEVAYLVIYPDEGPRSPTRADC